MNRIEFAEHFPLSRGVIRDRPGSPTLPVGPYLLLTTMWIVCQIGAREHYAIPRALHERGELAGLITDFWVSPGHVFSRLPGARRLRDRYHPDLEGAPLSAPNLKMLGFELMQRLAKHHGWPLIVERNQLFQQAAIVRLSSLSSDFSFTPAVTDRRYISDTTVTDRRYISESRSLDSNWAFVALATGGSAGGGVPTLFSYSYAARDLFRFAKERGWNTVLGQIDPGPEEERIVAAEHQRYRALGSRWQPAPQAYWQSWREELQLADRIIVNSEWSRDCLLSEGVAIEKMEIVPLVYEVGTDRRAVSDFPTRGEVRKDQSECQPSVIQHSTFSIQNSRSLRVLFLGQINLRKGIGRLLDAMRMLKEEPVQLTLAGPAEIDPSAWADLPKVHWIGPVARSEVGRHYAEADLFILPTLSDGYAITQLEALANGLPVMASKHCGEAVTHGRNGWILDDLEPETIAAAIRMAMVERPSDIRAPEFSLDDLAAALCG